MNKIESYAKVNLGLSVIRKTKRNYHKLKMVMSQIELHDEIYFDDSDDLKVTMDCEICDMENNLCYKVAKYLKEKYNVKQGIHIHINKKIPDGGGLGGGSSNAATVLSYLNNYWGLKLSHKQMKKIGFRFGCDIPFFIKGKLSYVYSYGEKVKLIKAKKQNDLILLIFPNFRNSTKIVFENHKLQKNSGKNIKKLIYGIKKGDYTQYIYNDLEYTADFLSCGEVTKIKEVLSSVGLKRNVMSGSGSTIVSYITEEIDIDKTVKQIVDILPNVKVVVSRLKMY